MVEEIRYPVLRLAHAVQAEAKDLLTRKVLGRALSEEELSAWMDDRGRLANSEISTPIDALALAHSLLQGVECATRFGGDHDALEHLVGEMTAATKGLIRFLENGVGRKRDELGLFDNFMGPTRQ